MKSESPPVSKPVFKHTTKNCEEPILSRLQSLHSNYDICHLFVNVNYLNENFVSNKEINTFNYEV